MVGNVGWRIELRQKLTVIALFLGSLGASIVSAQPLPSDTIDPAKRLPHFNDDTIDATLKTVTANHFSIVTPQGEQVVTAYTEEGLNFTLHFHQCDGEKARQCQALRLLTSWDGAGTERRTVELVRKFAPRNLFVNVGVLENGKPYMSRIIVAPHGMAQGNLALEVENFTKSANEFRRELLTLLDKSDNE